MVVNRRCQRTDWRLASASQAATSARSAVKAAAAGRIVDAFHRAARDLVALADFDRDDTLTRSRDTGRRRQRHRDARREAEPQQSGGCEDEHVVVAAVQLPQTCVEVAANRREAGARNEPRQLRDAPDAAGADHRRLTELGDEVLDGRSMAMADGYGMADGRWLI